jgi:hypothetical protein
MNGFEVISIYTRKQAIEDGVLTDVTELSKRAGFKLHTVIAEGLMNEVLREAARTEREIDTVIYFLLKLANFKIVNEGSGVDMIKIPLPWNKQRVFYVHIGPGDDGEAVLTLMFPEDY